MSKKTIFIATTLAAGCAVSGFAAGMVFGSRTVTKVLTRSGLSAKSFPDVINILEKYEALAYTASAVAKEENTTPETMFKFINVSMDVLRDNDLLQDPRFQEIYVNYQFDGITKNLEKEVGDDETDNA